ncbi:MAG: phytoene dehydrogenase [Cereibacter sphaeroides]|uniref:Pyridine nucleotide-disulfide oxidoreductase domain-containing protein 2 n=1 Tax=Cereibacter sphaeroides TaxID=1063 RepID=A0A2W5SNA1_CERSP|nr:MAG: phytoene dehydrogenase [Cereibacter sphaeroides]
MPTPSSEVIVIGGGTNGLACAARLAKGGRRVTLLESAWELGGGAATVEFAPGYRVSGLAHVLNVLDARVANGMDLQRHGLSYAATSLASTALAANGDHLVLDGAAGSGLTGNVTAEEKRAWTEMRTRLMAFAGVLGPFKTMAPPRLSRAAGNEWLRLAKLGLGVRQLGKEEFREFLRMILINVADAVEDDLTDDRLRGLLAFDTVLGAWLGPRSPNSLILLLNRLSGEAAGQRAALGLPKGGMGSVAAAMRKAAEAAGVKVRTGAQVERIIVEGDRATGVILASGEELKAGLVVSAINPRTTFRNLVGPRPLDAGFYRQTAHIRSRGGAAKLHLALKGAPDFRGADLKSRLVIAPGVNAVEESFNAVKYGEVPKRPVMEIIIPSAHEAGFAPDGHHVLSAIVQFAPHAPKAGLDAARAEMLENTLAVLEENAPGIRALIAHAELLMPEDIEARYGMVGGNWHHGELAVEQMLFLRPLREAAQYATPLPGLWLAGAGSHPGGGISGASGWNAAERILKEAA